MESKPADYTLEKVLRECQEVFHTKPPHIGEVVAPALMTAGLELSVLRFHT